MLKVSCASAVLHLFPLCAHPEPFSFSVRAVDSCLEILHTDLVLILSREILQILAVGIISLVAPGLWNANSATGAGGQLEPYLVK